MKTIRIFLASSEEMDYDRMVFGNLVRRLDDVYEKRGVRLKLFEWEDYDAAFNDRRKQDEYNEKVRESDVFLALFHKKAGQFTIEEFDVASEAFKEKASPKVYTYLKDLAPGEEATPELEAFKRRLFDEMGHYWCRYDNRDGFQLQFVMQLQLVENSISDNLTVENGEVCVDGLKVASMDRLQFAAGNEDYVKMSEELASLPPKIERARLRLEKFPDDEDLIDDLRQKLYRYNKLKEEFAKYQKILFNTAKRIARLQGERVTDRMRRALDAFNEGKISDANIILNEAEADADCNLDEYKRSRVITEQLRQNVINSIEELLLKTSTIMANGSVPIGERVNQTDTIFAQIDILVKETSYDTGQYAEALFNHAVRLLDYGYDERALHYSEKGLFLAKEVFGDNSLDVASGYDIISHCQRRSVVDEVAAKALDSCNKALCIRQSLLGDCNLVTARSYYSAGECYAMMGDYSSALDNYLSAFGICVKLLGLYHSETAQCCHEIGYIYEQQGEYLKAIEYLKQAASIRERVLGDKHLDTSFTYYELGEVYSIISDYPNAVIYYEKAVNIQIQSSEFCNDIFAAFSYEKLGDSYMRMNLFSKALFDYKKALMRLRSFWGDDDQDEVVELQDKIEKARVLSI